MLTLCDRKFEIETSTGWITQGLDKTTIPVEFTEFLDLDSLAYPIAIKYYLAYYEYTEPERKLKNDVVKSKQYLMDIFDGAVIKWTKNKIRIENYKPNLTYGYINFLLTVRYIKKDVLNMSPKRKKMLLSFIRNWLSVNLNKFHREAK